MSDVTKARLWIYGLKQLCSDTSGDTTLAGQALNAILSDSIENAEALLSHAEALEAQLVIAREALERIANGKEPGQYMRLVVARETARNTLAQPRRTDMTDAVDRKAVIEAVEAEKVYGDCESDVAYDIALDHALAAINALPSLESVDALVKAAREARVWLDWCIENHDAPDSSLEERARTELDAALSAFEGPAMTYGEAVDIALDRGNTTSAFDKE